MTASPTSTPVADAATRPFGAHQRMRWWVPIVLTVVVVAAIYALQFGLGAVAAIIEVGLLGKDPEDRTLTPLGYLTYNIAVAAIAPITVAVMAKAAQVPWRSVLTVGRRFSWRTLGGYLLAFTAVVGVAVVIMTVVEPASGSAFAITSTTIALLIIVLLTTPLQAAAEEIAFRGALTAAYASWMKAARPALVVGITVSTLLFALVHTSADPWMILNYLTLGASTAVMAVIARGLEPAIAFHVANNVLAMAAGALFAAGGGISQDRTVGTAGPSILLIVAAEAVAILVVWWVERRRTRTSSLRDPSALTAARS